MDAGVSEGEGEIANSGRGQLEVVVEAGSVSIRGRLFRREDSLFDSDGLGGQDQKFPGGRGFPMKVDDNPASVEPDGGRIASGSGRLEMSMVTSIR